MNERLARAILGQLRSDRTGPYREWRSTTDEEWTETLPWLDLSGLAIYFLREIERSVGLGALPASVAAALQERADDNRARTGAMLDELDTLCTSFEESRIAYAILKGIALVPDYCPHPEFRTQYDHDVLVDPEWLATAERTLAKEGYRRKPADEPSVVVYRPPQPALRFPDNSKGLYSPMLGRSVEVHLALWEPDEERIHIDLPDDFLDRARSQHWKGIQFRALNDVDCLFFQVLHAFKHILRNWCRLSTLLEIGRFLDRRFADTDFWAEFVARVERVRWGKEASLLVFTLAERLFGASMPDLLRVALNTHLSPALYLWIERYGLRAAMVNFHGDKSTLFLHEEFVQNRSEWVAIRRMRLFPLRRPHRPPAVVFQRGFSNAGRLWMESVHAVNRLRFHTRAGLGYCLEYPRWTVLRRVRMSAGSGAG